MQDVKAALKCVLPLWVALCAISVIWGLTMQTLPGLMEGANYYPTSWAANLAHYDPEGYLLAAEQGYGAAGRVFQSSVRFPLFPFFTRVVAQVTSIDTYLSLFVVSKIALLAGLVGLWLLVAHFHGAEQAERACIYILFPLIGTGYSWMMSYPEALHLALWAFGFYWLYKRQFVLCGLVTVLNVWTRPQGALIVPVFALMLVVDAIREHGIRGVLDYKLWLRGLITCGLPLLAYTAWILYISRLTQQPLSPLIAQAQYGRADFALPWVRFFNVLLLPFHTTPIHVTWGILFEYYQYLFIFLALIILGVLALRKRVPWALALFSLLSILPGLSSANYALGRYALLSWIPLALIYVIPKRFDKAIVPVGVALSFLTLVVVGLTNGVTP